MSRHNVIVLPAVRVCSWGRYVSYQYERVLLPPIYGYQLSFKWLFLSVFTINAMKLICENTVKNVRYTVIIASMPVLHDAEKQQQYKERDGYPFSD